METYLADKVSLSSGELVEIGMSDLESPRSKRSERSIEKSTCRVVTGSNPFGCTWFFATDVTNENRPQDTI